MAFRRRQEALNEAIRWLELYKRLSPSRFEHAIYTLQRHPRSN
jgi:hypothetical protein